MPYHIVSYHIYVIPCHVIPIPKLHYTMSYHIIPYINMSYHIHVIPCHVITKPCHIISYRYRNPLYHVVSHHILSYHTIPRHYHVIPYHNPTCKFETLRNSTLNCPQSSKSHSNQHRRNEERSSPQLVDFITVDFHSLVILLQ